MDWRVENIGLALATAGYAATLIAWEHGEYDYVPYAALVWEEENCDAWEFYMHLHPNDPWSWSPPNV